ncbi:vestitone reductase-like [Nicotiana tabacum]|uniref:Dihydroflavonol 4-reductase n=1 Tax=Nicotiana tabacum TaxID=4097 RepID=W8GG36_TOBAC|nr:vestitone reductase-like [Nicotiana tabacum]AHK22739.1 dihydroflavonol-4-reductase [Nicotiana tabacum]
MKEEKGKGRVCVTGGSGYLGSWMVMRLLQLGYSVNTTVRSHPDCKRDVSYLTNLPGAPERLRIFKADLDKPESFNPAIEGCIGVFHAAHQIDFENKESEETITQQSINGTLGILQACLNSKTVKRVVYTSSAATVMVDSPSIIDENSWTNVDLVRTLKPFGGSYAISKTLTEKAALEFAEKNGIDFVTVIPTWIHGPFITPQIPGSVRSSMEMILGHQNNSMNYPALVPFVHVDDVTNAHIFLLDNPNAKGRYMCSAVEITREKLAEFVTTRYPEFQKQITEYRGTSSEELKTPSLSPKKLLETGFKYKYGLEEMFDGAIECCKQRGIL